jgi:hypothetical protein
LTFFSERTAKELPKPLLGRNIFPGDFARFAFLEKDLLNIFPPRRPGEDRRIKAFGRSICFAAKKQFFTRSSGKTARSLQNL